MKKIGLLLMALLALSLPVAARFSLKLPGRSFFSWMPSYRTARAELSVEESTESPEVAFARLHRELTDAGWVPFSLSRETALYQNGDRLCATLVRALTNGRTQTVVLEKKSF